MEYLEILRVGKGDVLPLAFLDAGKDPVWFTCFRYDHFAVIRVNAGNGTEASDLPPQIGSKRRGQGSPFTNFSVGIDHPHTDTIDPVAIGVEVVIAEFKAHI